jgi:hypothetical protein
VSDGVAVAGWQWWQWMQRVVAVILRVVWLESGEYWLRYGCFVMMWQWLGGSGCGGDWWVNGWQWLGGSGTVGLGRLLRSF